MRALILLSFFIVSLPANAYFVGWYESLTNKLEVGYDDSGTYSLVNYPFTNPYVVPYEVPYPEPIVNLAPVLSESIISENGIATFYAATARAISSYVVRKSIGANTGVKQDAQSALFDGPATIRVYGYSSFSHISAGNDVTHNLGVTRVKGVISPGGRVQIIKTFRGNLSRCYEAEETWSHQWDSGVNTTGEPITFNETLVGNSYSAPCVSSIYPTNTNRAAITLHMYAYDGDLTDGSYSEIYIDGDTIEGAKSVADIDIQPSDENNVVETEGGFSDKMFVSILGSNYFDVGQIDAATVRFGPAEASPHKLPGTFVDTNGDGYSDLNLMFRIGATGITCEEIEDPELTGEKYDGNSFSGSDSVTTPDCPTSSCHP